MGARCRDRGVGRRGVHQAAAWRPRPRSNFPRLGHCGNVEHRVPRADRDLPHLADRARRAGRARRAQDQLDVDAKATSQVTVDARSQGRRHDGAARHSRADGDAARPTSPRPRVHRSSATTSPRRSAEQPLLEINVVGPYTPGALLKIVDDQLMPRLSSVPGIASVLAATAARRTASPFRTTRRCCTSSISTRRRWSRALTSAKQVGTARPDQAAARWR